MSTVLLSLEDVAQHLRVTLRTVRSWVRIDRSLPHRGSLKMPCGGEVQIAKVGARWLVRQEDLERFVASRFDAPAAPPAPPPSRRGRPRKYASLDSVLMGRL